MPYNVTKTNGQNLMSIGEAVVNTTYGISLIGQSYNNYGALIANNFVRLLENGANSTPPTAALAGQLWFNTTTKVLHQFDGERFRPMASYAVASAAPVRPLEGDQWWDTATKKLSIYDGTNWNQVPTIAQTESLIHSLLPKGAVIAWALVTPIPVGWAVCNGQNGTPNTLGMLPGITLVYIMKLTG